MNTQVTRKSVSLHKWFYMNNVKPGDCLKLIVMLHIDLKIRTSVDTSILKSLKLLLALKIQTDKQKSYRLGNQSGSNHAKFTQLDMTALGAPVSQNGRTIH